MKSLQTLNKKQNVHDMTVDYLISEANDNHEDSDDDFKEFEKAEAEEAEDRIYAEYKKRGGAGMNEDEIQNLAKGADVSQLETSIIASAIHGGYQPTAHKSRKGRRQQNMDLSILRAERGDGGGFDAANQSQILTKEFRANLDQSALLP